MLALLLFTACGPIKLGGEDNPSTEVVDTYELGWPINACNTEIPEEGTGHAVGDVLPQYTLAAQTGESVELHDFCGQVVYMEFGYFT